MSLQPHAGSGCAGGCTTSQLLLVRQSDHRQPAGQPRSDSWPSVVATAVVQQLLTCGGCCSGTHQTPIRPPSVSNTPAGWQDACLRCVRQPAQLSAPLWNTMYWDCRAVLHGAAAACPHMCSCTCTMPCTMHMPPLWQLPRERHNTANVTHTHEVPLAAVRDRRLEHTGAAGCHDCMQS